MKLGREIVRQERLWKDESGVWDGGRCVVGAGISRCSEDVDTNKALVWIEVRDKNIPTCTAHDLTWGETYEVGMRFILRVSWAGPRIGTVLRRSASRGRLARNSLGHPQATYLTYLSHGGRCMGRSRLLSFRAFCSIQFHFISISFSSTTPFT